LKIYLFIVLFVTLSACLVKGADPFEIYLKKSNIDYCSDPVLIADGITITGNPNIKGMKISFSGAYVSGEDQLIYTGKLTQSQPTPGTLELTGSNDIKDYEDAIRTITYSNSKPNPTLGVRKITISLNDVDYLPATDHFYRYVTSHGIRWSAAQSEAKSDAMMYYGLRGYLATVTSQAENDFIKLKTTGVGWIGGSDSLKEGEWRWVTGPEGMEDGGGGHRFYDTAGGPYMGAYTNWNSGEPNNAGDEDYAHITLFPGNSNNSYKWNDLADTGGSGDYASAGYLIEFGGFPGEPNLKLSATLDLNVNTLSDKTVVIPAICQGKSIILNQPDNSSIPAIYVWTSSDPSSILSSTTIANPVATPTKTTSYTMVVSRGTCRKSLEFTVPVIPNPTISFSVDSKTCYGYNLDVAYTGDPVPAASKYTWIFGGDTIASGNEYSKVMIPLGLNTLPSSRNLTLVIDQDGCLNQKTISGILVKPELSPWTVANAELCQYDFFKFSIANVDLSLKYNWNFGDGVTKSGTNVTHKYGKPGKYDVQLTMTNSDNCSNTGIIREMVYAQPVPEAKFSMDPLKVSNDQPKVNFLNESIGANSCLWDFGDGVTSSEISPSHVYGVGLHKMLLNVFNEFNCKDTVSTQVMVEFSHLYAPTGFSPNASNPIERVFLLNCDGIISTGYHLTVISRWNDIVFDVNEIKGWDGHMKNGDWAPTDTYIWVLYFTDFMGRKHRQTGSVTLVF
jgi:hypothetical protein